MRAARSLLFCLLITELLKDVTNANFGLLIAYVLPGFTTLCGISYFSPTAAAWLGTATAQEPSVGGFLYVTVASVCVGLTVSTVRWAIIDFIHHHTGIRRPDWNFSQLGERIRAFDVLIEIHYRYFQFYANSLIALSSYAVLRWVATGFQWIESFGVLCLLTLFFAASRDTLRKYYARVEGLLESG